MPDLAKIIIIHGFAIVGAISATRWALRKVDSAEARCRHAFCSARKDAED